MMNMYKVFFSDSPSYPMKCLAESVEDARAQGNLYRWQWGLCAEISDIQKAYGPGDVPFHELPPSVQDEVKDVLQAYDEAWVVFECGRYEVTTTVVLQSKYPKDHFPCGEYKAEDIFTEKERIENFVKEFGYSPGMKLKGVDSKQPS